MGTAADAVFLGRERACNRHFPPLGLRLLVEPVACTSAADRARPLVASGSFTDFLERGGALVV